MLISFSLANFRSFKGWQTISFVANKKYHSKNLINNSFATKNLQVPNLLKSLALYGANASGKSNVVKAFMNCYEMVLDDKRNRGDKIERHEPFILDDKTELQPTEYCLDFIASDNVRYIYSFAFDSNKIHYEKLEFIDNKKNASPQLIYEISFKKDKFYSNFTNFNGDYKTYQKIFENTQNNLFLNISVNMGDKSLNPIYDWFKDYAEVMFEHHENAKESFLWIKESPENKAKLLRLINKFDLSIKDIDIKVYERSLPKEIEEDDKIPAELKQKFKMKTITPIFINKNGKVLNRRQISDGTFNLITCAPLLFKILATGGVLFADELDRSIHPDILIELVKMFNDKNINQSNAQILFTVHNDVLLDKKYNLLGRDQVWFASKENKDQSTELYCLDQFTGIRNSDNIVERYRDNQYGARPFINNSIQLSDNEK